MDLAIELSRRSEVEQIPLAVAQNAILFASEWMRVSVMQFVSSEGASLMGIHDFGEWKAYFIERFKGILDLTVKGSLSTNSPVPSWALERIKEAWHLRVD